MKTSWSRWRAYFERLEDLLRLTGERLADERTELRREFGYERLTRGDRARIERETVRRCESIPFFSELTATALDLDRETAATPCDPGMLDPWGEGETVARSPSDRRDGPSSIKPDATGDAPLGTAPARLRNAERVLAMRTRSLTVVLDDLTNPLNASAVVRTCEALGLQEIHFRHPRGRIALNPGIHKECHRWLDLNWHRHAGEAASELRRRGYALFGADFGSGSVPIEELPLGEKTAFVFGNEQEGLSSAFRAEVDGLFHIPSAGFTSYVNVSNAVAIAVSLFDRRLREAGLRAPLTAEETMRLRRSWYALLGRTRARRDSYLAWADDPPAPLSSTDRRLRDGER